MANYATLGYTTPFNASNGIGAIAFERIAWAQTSASEFVYLDDAGVTAMAQYKLREIDLNVIGCSLAVSPRSAASVIGCTGTTTRTFTVINNGAYDITGFTVQEVEPLGGNAYDYPWLTLSDTTGVTIPSGSSADVTATIDLDQVSGTEKASLKFSSTCSSGTSVDTLVDALTVTKLTVISPQIVIYPGNKDPRTPNSGGTNLSFGTFDTTSSPATTAVADPAALDKLAYEIADISGQKTKFMSVPAATIVPATGATLVARVKTVSISPDPLQYGNLWIEGPNITASVNWGGTTGVLRDSTHGQQVTLTDPQDANADYHVIRLTSRDTGGATGIVVNVYFDERPTPVLTVTNAAPNNRETAAPGDGFGFGVASTADAQDFFVDCFAGTDAGAFAPGEEEACLGFALTCPNLCHTPYADVDGDGDVDQADFAVFQLCYTGRDVTFLPPGLPEYCACLDHADDDNDPLTPPGPDGNIDSFDLTAFERCASGPAVPADPNCGG